MALLTFKSTNSEHYVVGLTLGLGIGYRISGGAILAPRPTVQTLTTLNGATSTWVSSATNVIISDIVCPSVFATTPEGQGTIYTVTINNIGLAPLVVETPIFSNLVTEARPIFSGGLYSSPPWTIQPGDNAKFGLSYYTADTGVFNEAIVFRTNEAGVFKRKDLLVTSSQLYQLTLTPNNSSFSTSLPNENRLVPYTLSASLNGNMLTDVELQYTPTLSGNPAWTIDSVQGNIVTLRFDSARFNNATGTYVSTLTINGYGVQIQATSTASHSVDLVQNRSSSSWISTLTQPDAIIGARIDLVNGQRTLTLGVGSGADGSDSLSQNNIYFRAEYLNPIYGRGRIPFPYWQTVYQMPLTSSTSYLSGNYRVKTQSASTRDYDWYFGHYNSTGSLFLVDVDPFGNTSIRLNDLRETTQGLDPVLDATLDRLTRSFYYYSLQDQINGGRVTQLGNRLDNNGNVYETITPPLSFVETTAGTKDVKIRFSSTHALYVGQPIDIYDIVRGFLQPLPAWLGNYVVKSVDSSTQVSYESSTVTNWVSSDIVSVSTTTLVVVPSGEFCLFFAGFDQTNNTVTSLVAIPPL